MGEVIVRFPKLTEVEGEVLHSIHSLETDHAIRPDCKFLIEKGWVKISVEECKRIVDKLRRNGLIEGTEKEGYSMTDKGEAVIHSFWDLVVGASHKAYHYG